MSKKTYSELKFSAGTWVFSHSSALSISAVLPAASIIAKSLSFQPLMPSFSERTLLKPSCCMVYAAKIERLPEQQISTIFYSLLLASAIQFTECFFDINCLFRHCLFYIIYFALN